MRLDFIEASGFRGFRDKVRLDFGAGFTVISGRNGVGKSTVFDAVEFALTGSIDKYAVEKSAKESLSDYLWWRGNGVAKAHYVTVGFVDDEGIPFSVTRTREGGADRSSNDMEAVLCPGPHPEDAIRQLCKTSIIRDEWISALSLDLTETERFELVRAALGPIEGAERTAKASQVLASAETMHKHQEGAYETARTQLSERLVQLSEAQDAVSRSGDVSQAMQLVAEAVPNAAADLMNRLSAGRTTLTERRVRLERTSDLAQRGKVFYGRQLEFDRPEAHSEREAALLSLQNAGAAKSAAEQSVQQAEDLLRKEEESDALAASLAALIDHGERLGLHDGHCPLCNAMRSSPEFRAGVDIARSRVAALESGVTAARAALSGAQMNAERPMAEYAAAQAQWNEFSELEAELSILELELIDELAAVGLDTQLTRDPDELERIVADERDKLINLERALRTLEASQAVSRLGSLEAQIASLRAEADRAADGLERSQAALTAARSIERNVRRVSAEIIDERLAQISPLLNELYQRLRPHFDWRTIDYSIRGDVRRFLSLKVGGGLNPQFVFSSGQRRAAGLAFLLSVHLARAWTPWRTLLLDDPVQHIDDFRALQLVEILAALRMDGRQIVCAVEDAALADLLARRLVSTSEQMGYRYDVDLGPAGSSVISDRFEVPPLPVGVLRAGSGLQAVS
ncbi:MAG: chromosome segregation protein SMC [Mesorhizobium sp.]|nr:MAG: chromosome segregation protein SMC [Mesorhizobium sp.]